MNCNPMVKRRLVHCDRKQLFALDAKEVKKSVFGMPSAEDYYEAKYHFQGCIPDFPSLELGAAVIVMLHLKTLQIWLH